VLALVAMMLGAGASEAFGAGPPTVVTGAASSVTQSAATLNATVNPNGAEVTKCKLEYGTTLPSASSTPCTPAPGLGTAEVAASGAVTGLVANTTYRFRIVATNSGGTKEGSERTFKTLPNAPTVVTGAAASVTQSSATLNATVNPNGGLVSECKLEYGTTLPSASSAPCTPSPGSGNTEVPVSASVAGLLANTTYRFRIVATNPGGTSQGAEQTFTTLPNAPTVVTGAASSITQTSATFNAKVNPNGGAVSECKFEYGTTLPSASSAPCTPSPGSGNTEVPVSASVAGLLANTTYRFRILATNPGGTSQGAEQTFTTLPNAPTAETAAPSSVTQTSATLNATVNPHGGEVSECKLEYGTTLPSASSAACTPAPAGTTEVAVSAPVTGLLANTTYHFRIVVTGTGGTGDGIERTFTTLPNPPTAETAPASSIAQTSATLNATVNPNGGDVSDCKFEYGTTSSYGSSAACSSLPGSGSSAISVLAKIAGLNANTTYHFRIVATNSGGTSEGTDQTFTTLANTITVTVTVMPGPAPIIVHLTPPNSTFKTLGAVFNPTSHMITFTESVAEPGTFSWLLTFQNGKFGLFGRTSAKCKNGFVKLGGKCRPSKIVFARGSASVTSAGTVTFALKPTPSGLKALKNAYKLKKSLPVAMSLRFQSVRSTSPVSRLLALTVRTR
jgi:hypothetical protein